MEDAAKKGFLALFQNTCSFRRSPDDDGLSAAEQRSAKPGTVFMDCSDSCPEMVVIPPGRYVMGSQSGKPDDYLDVPLPFNAYPLNEVTLANEGSLF
jgi:hypothetical protein